MTRSAMHRGRLVAIAGGILLVAVGCPRRISPSSVWYVEPIPESGDEQAGRRPPQSKLGGPYGNGSKAARPREQTAAAPVRLTPTVDDGVLARYLDALTFDMARDNGELAVVRCPQGSASGCHALLYIQPEIGMLSRSISDMPGNGMVVARIINYSLTESDSTYGIPPLTRAYWYVYPTSSGKRSRVFIRTPGSATTLQFLGAERTYESCGHASIGFAAVARFRKCEQQDLDARGKPGYGGRPTPLVRRVSWESTLHSSMLAADGTVALTDTELWVKCAQGCCVAGP